MWKNQGKRVLTLEGKTGNFYEFCPKGPNGIEEEKKIEYYLEFNESDGRRVCPP